MSKSRTLKNILYSALAGITLATATVPLYAQATQTAKPAVEEYAPAFAEPKTKQSTPVATAQPAATQKNFSRVDTLEMKKDPASGLYMNSSIPGFFKSNLATIDSIRLNDSGRGSTNFIAYTSSNPKPSINDTLATGNRDIKCLENYSLHRFKSLSDNIVKINGRDYAVYGQEERKQTWLSSIYTHVKDIMGLEHAKARWIVQPSALIGFGVGIPDYSIFEVKKDEVFSGLKEQTKKLVDMKVIAPDSSFNTQPNHFLIQNDLYANGKLTRANVLLTPIDYFPRILRSVIEEPVTTPVVPITTAPVVPQAPAPKVAVKDTTGPAAHFNAAILGGYQNTKRHEIVSQINPGAISINSDLNLNRYGVYAKLFGNGSYGHLLFGASAEGNAGIDGEYIDNLTGNHIGGFNHQELNLDGFLGLRAGPRGFNGQPRVIYLGEFGSTEVNYNGAVNNLQSNRSRHLVGAGGSVNSTTSHVRAGAGIDYLIGQNTQNDRSPEPGAAFERSRAKVEGFQAHATLGLNDIFDLTFAYQNLGLSPREGFTQGTREHTISIGGQGYIGDHLIVGANYKHLNFDITGRNQSTDQNQFSIFGGYRIGH